MTSVRTSAGNYHGRVNPFAGASLGMTSTVLVAVLVFMLAVGGPLALLILFFYRRQQKRQVATQDFRINIRDKQGSSQEATSATSPIRWSTQLTTSSSSSHSSTSNASSQQSGGSVGRLRHKTQHHLSPLRSSLEGLGSLEFSLTYDVQNNLLQIGLRSFSDTTNPGTYECNLHQFCVKVQLLPEKRDVFLTKLFRRVTISAINETFTFRGIDLNCFRSSRINMILLSVDRFSKKTVVGEVLAPLNDFDLSGGPSDAVFSKELQPKPPKIKSISASSLGQLLVSLSLRPNENRLNVAILKAAKLHLNEEASSKKSIYAKICLVYLGQQIARRKTCGQQPCRDPVFNESVQLDLPSQAAIGDTSLKIMLFEADTKGSSPSGRSLGEIEFNANKGGNSLGGTTGKHWSQMLETPRKQTAMWHDLKIIQTS